MNRFEKSLNEMKNSFITPTAPLKAVTEVFITCGSNHSYQCPLTRGGNDFPVFHDNIQQFQTAANSGSMPLMSVNFQAIAFLRDLRTLIRAVFSLMFRSFAIMTGHFLFSPRNAYSSDPDSLYRCDPIWGCYRLVSEPGYREPGRVFWGANEKLSDEGSPRVIVYGYDGLSMQPVAPPSPEYVPGPEHPPSPDFVLGPEHPPFPVYVPYLPEPEYPEYLVPFDAEAPLEDQPLPVDASPTALSPGYVADSDPDEDPKEDPK
nr:hypothetical protein [Tanacetum cinerariifolium]